MSWKKSGGIDFSKFSNNITSSQSNFNKLETLQINSNNTFLHVASNTLRLGNNTGNYEQINALWFGGLDDNDYDGEEVTVIPRSSLEERYFDSEYVGDIKRELFIFKGNYPKDRIRLKSSNILFDTYEDSLDLNYPTDRYAENIRMIIDDTGKIGVNTITPRTKLDVNGTLLAHYGNGIMGNGTINGNTQEIISQVYNAYYYCGTLSEAFEVSQNQELNNDKMRIEVFGGELTGSNGFGIDTYIISNNAINQGSYSNSEIDNKKTALIFKSSVCGGAGLGSNNDLYSLAIFRNSNGKDDVYVYIKGYSGTTINIRSFLISNHNNSSHSMEEQNVVLSYQSVDGKITPSTDENIQRSAVYGVDTASESVNEKYMLKVGVIERFDDKIGLGSEMFPSNTDYGAVTGITNISMNGNTLLDGNIRVNENMYVDKDVTIFGKLYLNGEMQVNSVVMENYQILEKAYIGGGLRLNSDQLQSVPNREPNTIYNQNHIIFDNTQGNKPTTQYEITQYDEYVSNTEITLPGYVDTEKDSNILTTSQDLTNSIVIGDKIKIGDMILSVTNIDNTTITTGSNATENSNGALAYRIRDEKQYDFMNIGRTMDNWKCDADISIDGSTGYIGIGTTKAKNKLDIMGSVCVGENYAEKYITPENGMLIEGSVGIGLSNPILNSNSISLNVSGSCTIGKFLASSTLANDNGMLVQNSLGVGVLKPRSMLDVGGSIRFGDGSVQSYATTTLGARTNAKWDLFGTRNNVFKMFNSKYSNITNNLPAPYVVACNNDGSIIFIGSFVSTIETENGAIANSGSVTSYRWCKKEWCRMGNTIVPPEIDNNEFNRTKNGEAIGSKFATAISCSGDGHILIVGSPDYCYNNLDYCGRVTIYQWNSSGWNNVISFYGLEENINFGSSVKVNKNGDNFLAGGNNINYIYYYNTTLTLDGQIGNFNNKKIENKSENNNTNEFGHSMDLNREGTIIAVGSPNAEVEINNITYNSGCVYIYIKKLDNSGNLVFDDTYYIKIKCPYSQNDVLFGNSVSLISNGGRLAIGAPNFDNNIDGESDNINIGLVQLYKTSTALFNNNVRQNDDNSDKIEIYGTLFGNKKNEHFGYSVVLNGSGQYLITGSIGTTTVSGVIKMFEYNNLNSWSIFSSDYEIDGYDLPASSLVASSDNTTVIFGYGQKYVEGNSNYYNADAIKLGIYENTIISDKLGVIDFLGINNTDPNRPIDILSTEYQDIININANCHPSTLTSDGIETFDLNSYVGGISIQNDNGGKTTYYLNNNDVLIDNKNGGFIFNYDSKFEVCKNGDENCTLFASKGYLGINNSNPMSNLDILGKVILKDGINENMLISNKSYLNNITGSFNIGLGHSVLMNNTEGSGNTMIGYSSGKYITDSSYNVSLGYNTLSESRCESFNTAIGANSLYQNVQVENTAIGYNSLGKNTQGMGNSSLGAYTDVDGINHYNYSTAIGYKAIIGKSNSIILGDSTNDLLSVGVGINNPLKTFHVNGDGLFEKTLTVNKEFSPLGGIYVEDKLTMDVVEDIFTINHDLVVGGDTKLNTLTIDEICMPNGGLKMVDGENGPTVFRIRDKGFTTIGDLGTSSNVNNPLVTMNGYVLINNGISITGDLNCQNIKTNVLTFYGNFVPDGGVKMFNQSGSEVLCLEENSGNIITYGTLSVSQTATFSRTFVTVNAEFTQDCNVSIQGKIDLPNNSQMIEGNLYLSDNTCYLHFSETIGGIEIGSNALNGSDMEISNGINKTVIKKDLVVEGSITTGDIEFGGIIPVGGIIMWNGTSDELPGSWALCDGTNNTPDLRGRFILGSTNGLSVSVDTSEVDSNGTNIRVNITTPAMGDNSNTNIKGGFAETQLTEDNLPKHSDLHELSFNEHTHDISNDVIGHKHDMDKDIFNRSNAINAYGRNFGPTTTSGSMVDSTNGTVRSSDQWAPLANSSDPANQNSSLYQLNTVQGVQPGTAGSVYALAVQSTGADTTGASLTVENTPIDRVALYSDSPNLNTNPLTSEWPTDGANLTTTRASTTDIVNMKNEGNASRYSNQPQYYVLAFIMRIK